jgi:imidazole glycerol-phosphate synthase subunit HisH
MTIQNSNITIVDYGMGNLFSVAKGLENCGATVTITDSPELIVNADRLILPGVGSYASGMKELHKRNLIDSLKKFSESERPFMGICLGMQMMLSWSQEFGKCDGLNFIPGKVVEIPKKQKDGTPHKIPHIGWNEIFPTNKAEWNSNILIDVKPKSSVYFVHSFMAKPDNKDHIIANCSYNGQIITSIIHSNNLYGCQFHPEKSGIIGLKILENFCNV